jgi:hypothetical protein
MYTTLMKNLLSYVIILYPTLSFMTTLLDINTTFMLILSSQIHRTQLRKLVPDYLKEPHRVCTFGNKLKTLTTAAQIR